MADHKVNDKITKERGVQDRIEKSETVSDKIEKTRDVVDLVIKTGTVPVRIEKVCTLPFEVDQGLLNSWKSTYSPDVLMGFDETSGTTAEDSSGNGRDATYLGTYTLDNPGIFAEDKQGVDLDDTDSNALIKWNGNYSEAGPSHSMVLANRLDNLLGSSYHYFIDIDGGTGGDRLIMRAYGNDSTGYGWWDGNHKNTNWAPQAGNEALYGLSLDGGTSNGYAYVNGLPVFSRPYNPRSLGTGPNAWMGTNKEVGRGPKGLYSLFMHRGTAQSHDDHYQQWLDVTDGQTHYYKETIIDDQGLATLGSQGDVLCHLPVWETAGSQAVDVSMHENHADFVNGPTLGLPPISEQAVYAVESDLNLRSQVDVGLDFSTGSYSFMLEFQISSGAGGTKNFAGADDGSGNGVWILSKDNQLRLRVDDGTTIRQAFCSIGLSIDTPYRCIARIDWPNNIGHLKVVELEGAGSAESSVDITDVTSMPSLTNPFYFGNSGGSGLNGFTGKYGLPTIFNRYLTDAEVDGLLGV